MKQISDKQINNINSNNYTYNNIKNYNYSEIDFLQNLSAARESSLLSKFNRIKLNIEKLNESLNGFEGVEEEFKKIEENLNDEKIKYQKLLIQINNIRNSNIKEELSNNIENILNGKLITQTISYYSDTDFYVNVLENNSINIAKSKQIMKKNNKSKFDDNKIQRNNSYSNEYLLF